MLKPQKENAMSIIRFEIDNYQLTKGAAIKTVLGDQIKIVRGIIGCYGDDYILAFNFTDNTDDYYKSSYDSKRLVASLFLPLEDMSIITDMLRNEKPIYAHINTEFPEQSSISTMHEPVGEGE